jgi:hypothetical protein
MKPASRDACKFHYWCCCLTRVEPAAGSASSCARRNTSTALSDARAPAMWAFCRGCCPLLYHGSVAGAGVLPVPPIRAAWHLDRTKAWVHSTAGVDVGWQAGTHCVLCLFAGHDPPAVSNPQDILFTCLLVPGKFRAQLESVLMMICSWLSQAFTPSLLCLLSPARVAWLFGDTLHFCVHLPNW